MKKIICDRCGKEIGGITYENLLQNISSINYKLTSQVGFDVRIYDLCDDCQHDLTNWLNNFISLHNFNQEDEK